MQFSNLQCSFYIVYCILGNGVLREYLSEIDSDSCDDGLGTGSSGDQE